MFKAGQMVRCIDPYLREIIAKDQVVEVVKDQEEDSEYVKVFADKPNDKATFWKAKRFVAVDAPKAVAPEPVPLTKENAKVGLKVVLNNLGVHAAPEGAHLVGKVVEIHSLVPHVSDMLYLCELKGQPLKFRRFTLAPQEAIIEPGCKLIVVDPHRESGLRKDKIVTLKAIQGVLYRLEEYSGAYRASRFQLAGVAGAGPAKPVEVPLKPGNEVYCLRGTTEYVNDGERYVIYTVDNARKRAYISEINAYIPLADLERCTADNKPPPKPAFAGDIREKLQKKDGGYAICSFAYITKKNQAKVNYHITPACYAPLGRTGGSISQLAISTKGWKSIKEPFITAYMGWLLNTSPWAHCFLTKDVEEAKTKGVAMDCNKPIGELVGAATALREATEYCVRNTMFMWAIQNGFDGNVAYLLGATLNVHNNVFGFNICNGAHQAIMGDIDADDMFSFFANGYPDKKQKPANEECAGFSVCRWVGATESHHSYSMFVHKHCKKTEKGEGWHKSVSISEDNVIEFAMLLQQKIKEAKK